MKKYTSFFISSWIGILTVLTDSIGFAQDLPGDTLQLPFTENWSSGSFTTNGWYFPNGQGAWLVENNYGDPSPSAVFYGFPTMTNYSYTLSSAWYDGKEFRCSDIWLDFDLKLIEVTPSGTEKLTIEKEYDTSWISLYTVRNDSGISWKHFHLYMGFANNHYFKIGFLASGVNSSSLDSWYIDNIQLNYVCQPPSGLVESSNASNDSVYLSWNSPNCGTGELTYLIYDDGSWETGWMISQGYNGWLGNEFPVSGMTGTIESISAFWLDSPCGIEPMTIDIFDANRLLVATTDTFLLFDGGWVAAPVNNIPFSGTFYAMAHWTPTSNCTHFLGDDENGPYTSQDLAWYTDGSTWEKVSTLPSGEPSVFLLRATVFVNDEKKMVELLPEASQKNPLVLNDSMVVAGYNIYRKPLENDSSFIRINANPVQATQFIDPTVNNSYPGYYYYVTSVYDLASTNNFLCESAGTDTVFASLVVNVGEKKEKTRLKVFPVPSSTIVNLQSDKIITGVEIDDHLGSIRLTEGNLREKEYSFPVERLSPGLYFLKVMTGEGIITRKILVLH